MIIRHHKTGDDRHSEQDHFRIDELHDETRPEGACLIARRFGYIHLVDLIGQIEHIEAADQLHDDQNFRDDCHEQRIQQNGQQEQTPESNSGAVRVLHRLLSAVVVRGGQDDDIRRPGRESDDKAI